ncbi:SIR2 family NAD-dependent protein deacylase [Acetobacterium woodii]|uniref:Uncharacterized protein n=1 Tax=Acetobacterium woodii (strain ATCC 29683 / DSM 1030 / JCM 2381 / KCTC 1655 / WB1) TaxID=931626 RepID=H6LHR8_ACEWD|nr:SIR2 family protein [Acetobacterium woodii]AFA47247.1 hypothetical protein Awo_c04460 [Acetobacterium woodii DSM 1030]
MSKNLVNTYIEDIAKRLHDPRQFGTASIMVGAGFSKNANNLGEGAYAPNWEELAIKMYEVLYLEPSTIEEKIVWEKRRVKKTSGKNVLKLAEEYKVIFGRNKLDRFIEQNINDDQYDPGQLHEKLLELNWKDVFTTNYDTLLERAINKVNVRRNYKIILNQNDLPGSIHPRIIKLHGSIPNSKPYIISEEDYRTYPSTYAPFVNTVQQAMLETQLCLIGFSGDDPNFLSWIGWLRDNMGENCPQIYLCNVFNDMSDSEKKILESQKISIVDLACLVEEPTKNIYQDALEKFLEKLKNYGQEEKTIFDKLKLIPTTFAIDINEAYYKKMIDYTVKVKKITQEYFVLPFTELKYFTEKLNEHFQNVSYTLVDKSKFILMGNATTILRKLYVPLYNVQASKIEELLSSFPYNSLNKKNGEQSNWFELSMYLAEMYRLDGKIEEYNKITNKIEEIKDSLDGEQTAKYCIEICMSFLSRFDYNNALKQLEKIGENITYEIQIKKACLLNWLGEEKKASELLKKCSASLAQTTYSENKSTLLISYLYMCSYTTERRLHITGFWEHEFSDNKYNSKKILNDIKLSLTSNLLHAQNKRETIERTFNPNAQTQHFGTTPIEIRESLSDSFRYLLFQDNLCLRLQNSDEKEMIAKAATEIVWTSENPLWKWSFIIRTNDEKVVKNYFTRELIVTSNKEWTEKLFDQLMLLLNDFTENENFRDSKKIVTQMVIYTVLPRLCIVLDDERILKLVRKIFQLLIKDDFFINIEVRSILKCLSYSLNLEILKKSIVEILDLTSTTIPISTYFEHIDFERNENVQEIPDQLISKIIGEIKNDNLDIRDCGISKVVLLYNLKQLPGNKKNEIANAIWNKKNESGFPLSNLYSIGLWEELPFISGVSFEDLYVNYLKNPKFSRCVYENKIEGNMNVDGEIFSYMNAVYFLSVFQKKEHYKVNWSEDLVNNILEYLFEYLNNEQALFQDRIDIFGTQMRAKNRFLNLSNLVAILLTQAIISDTYNTIGQDFFIKIKTVFIETETPMLGIETIEKLFNKDYENVFELLSEQIMLGSLEELFQAFIALDIIIIYKENFPNKLINIENDLFIIFKSLKYMDVKICSSIFLCLMQVIDRDLFSRGAFPEIIVQTFVECYDIYEIAIKKVNKDCLDAIYNLSKLARCYYNTLINNGIKISMKMDSLIEQMKKSPLNEVKNQWENYSLARTIDTL